MTDRYVEVVRTILKVCMPAFLLAVIVGCPSVPSVKRWADQVIGCKISGIVETEQRPQSYSFRSGHPIRSYQQENGNFVYIQQIGPSCLIYWDVNASGIVTGYRTEGDGCW